MTSTYAVTPATVITRINAANGGGGSVALGALRPGDRVDVIVGNDNSARRVRATFNAQ